MVNKTGENLQDSGAVINSRAISRLTLKKVKKEVKVRQRSCVKTTHSTEGPLNIDEVKDTLGQLTPLIVSSKMEQQAVLAQSAVDGGPTDTNSAIINLMDYCKIGYRALALETGRKRKVLQAMIQGILPMPPEVVSELYDIFKKRKPDLFK